MSGETNGGDPPTSRYTFNCVKTRVSKSNALGRATTFQNDTLKQMVHAISVDPHGAAPLASSVTTYAYDAAGQLVSTTDPLGRVTSYTYDDLGRVTSTTRPDPDGAGPLTAPVTSYGYDKMGNRTSVTDPLGHALPSELGLACRRLP